MIKKVNAKYNALSTPVKMSLWFLICSFLQKGIVMFTTPIFTRVMTNAEFGRFNVYSSWLSIFTVFATLNISGNCYTRGLVVGKEEDRDVYTSSLQSLSAFLIFIFFCIYYVFHKVINKVTEMSTYMYVIMFVEMLTTTAYNFWINRRRVDFKYRQIVELTVLFTVLRPLVSVLFVWKASETTQVEARLTAIAVVNLTLFSGILIRNIWEGKQIYSSEYWKKTVLYCIPLIPHYFSSVILSHSDRLMINYFCGNSYVAFYSVAYSLGMVMQIFNNAVSSSLNPWMYKTIKNKELDRIAPIAYSLLIVIAFINLIMVALAPELLALMAPASYKAAVWAIAPVTASVYFLFMYDLFASFQFFYGKTKWIAWGTLGSAIINVVLNIICIPIFGFAAAGYTTLVCYVLYGVFHYYFMRKICDEYLNGYKVYNGFVVVVIGLALMAGIGIMMALYEYIIIRLAIIFVVVLTAFIFRNKIIGLIKTIRK